MAVEEVGSRVYLVLVGFLSIFSSFLFPGLEVHRSVVSFWLISSWIDIQPQPTTNRLISLPSSHVPQFHQPNPSNPVHATIHGSSSSSVEWRSSNIDYTFWWCSGTWVHPICSTPKNLLERLRYSHHCFFHLNSDLTDSLSPPSSHPVALLTLYPYSTIRKGAHGS
ncbi:hypothetical protein EX30DRAFT_244988 [Ascodesmis nigricans]|uniref:Uncharacterized protein n=1 Tax=Ascodesmis nigricans TaxID=341454 RepID=A0A4S2MPW0_9PEZI|nr:hypothetical protein EX30DRAFT_244988 [Ascodesmis nigricans]